MDVCDEVVTALNDAKQNQQRQHDELIAKFGDTKLTRKQEHELEACKDSIHYLDELTEILSMPKEARAAKLETLLASLREVREMLKERTRRYDRTITQVKCCMDMKTE